MSEDREGEVGKPTEKTQLRMRNGAPFLPRRPGSGVVTLEMIKRMEEEGDRRVVEAAASAAVSDPDATDPSQG
jgi:hypothetical protein